MTGSANMEADQRATATLADISGQLKALENVARVRGSPTCDHLAGRLAEVRRDLQRVIDQQPAAVDEVMVERAAIALADVDRPGRDPQAFWNWLHEEERIRFRRRAQAALAAQQGGPQE